MTEQVERTSLLSAQEKSVLRRLEIRMLQIKRLAFTAAGLLVAAFPLCFTQLGHMGGFVVLLSVGLLGLAWNGKRGLVPYKGVINPQKFAELERTLLRTTVMCLILAVAEFLLLLLLIKTGQGGLV